MNKNIKLIYLLGILFLIVDQILKVSLNNILKLNESINVIKNFFSITLVHNKGAAFSILNGNRVFLVLIGLLAVIGIGYYLKKEKSFSKSTIIIYSLLIGGILGNLIDRIFYGYVVDYISFKFAGYYFPIFNLADTFIVISVILLIFSLIKEELWKL